MQKRQYLYVYDPKIIYFIQKIVKIATFDNKIAKFKVPVRRISDILLK